MSMRQKVLSILALLMAVTGAWAQTYTVTFSGASLGALNEAFNNVTMPYSFSAVNGSNLSPWNVIADEGASYTNVYVSSGGEGKVSVSNTWNNMTITISGAFEGTATIHCEGLNDDNNEISSDVYVTCVDVAPAHATIEVTDAGWATYYTPFALDFTKEDDYYTLGELTAYTAKLVDGEVVLTKVDNVPAGTGVVLKAAEGTYYVPEAASSTTDKGDLQGNNDQDTNVEVDGWTFYVLGMNGNNEAQFQRASSGSIPAGKAYLMVYSGEAPALDVVFGDATGIEAVKKADTVADGAYYNLAGQRVAQPTKGLYIVNGKKVVIK